MVAALAPRWRKVVRDLAHDRLRTTLAVLSITIGVFAVGLITSSQVLLREELNGGWADSQPADATLYTSAFDDELVALARRAPGVQDAEGRRSVWLRFRYTAPLASAAVRAVHAADAVAAQPDSEWRELRLLAIPNYESMRVSRITPERGAWPPGRGEVLLERAALEHAGVGIGGEITVEAAGGRERVLRVTGITHDRNRADAVLEQSTAGYVTLETMEWLGYGGDLDELHLVVEGEKNRESIETIAEAVRHKIEKGGRTVAWTWVPEPGEHPLDDTITPLFLILTVLGGLATALSSLLVINTILALLARQVRQIGVMKAVGARTVQVAGLYLGSVALFGALSLGVAVPLGALGARAFSAWLAGLLNVNPPALALPWRTLMAQAGVALVVPVLAAAWPVALGARVPIRRALSEHGHGDRSYGGGRLDDLLRRIPRLSRPQQLALRNTFRRTGRLSLTLLTLALAGAIITSVFTVRSSLNHTLDGILQYWGHDVRISFRKAQRGDVLVREALSVPGVSAAEAWGFHSSRRVRPDGTESGDVLIVGPAPESGLITPRLQSGRWLDPADERGVVLNGEFVSEEPDHIALGDEVVLQVEQRDVTFNVVGILSNTRSGPRAYVNFEALGRLTGGVDRAGSVRVATERHDADFQKSVGKALEARFEARGIGVDGVDVMAAQREATEYQFNILITILLVMAVLLGLVGAMGLTSTMSMNVMERTREIGVMRSIGASHRDVLGLVLLEGLVIGLLSAVLGLIAAVPMGRAFGAAVGIAFMDGPLDHRFSVGGAALWIGVVLLFSITASVIPAWSAMRVSVRDALHYE